MPPPTSNHFAQLPTHEPPDFQPLCKVTCKALPLGRDIVTRLCGYGAEIGGFRVSYSMNATTKREGEAMLTVQEEIKSRLHGLERALSVKRADAWSEDRQINRLVGIIQKARREVEEIREAIYGHSEPDWLHALDRP